MQNFFTTLSNTVKQANKDIDAAKLKLTTEIAAIGEIKTETETTRFYVDYDDLMLSLLKEAAVDSICQCNTPFNYLFRCFELQCLSRSVV